MSTAKKILGNTIVQVLGRAVMAVASVGILKSVSHFLGVAGYGQYTTVYEFLAFFGIAADFGLFTIGVRELSKGERERDFVVGNILGMRLLTAVVMMAVAGAAVLMIPQYQGTFIPMGVLIAALAVLLAILQGTVSSVLQVEHKMQHSTFALVGSKLIGLGWMLAVIFWAFKGDPSQEAFNQLMVAGVIGNLFALLYTVWAARHYASLALRYDREYWKSIFTGAFPYGIALVLNMIYFRVDSVLLSLLKDSKEVGFYGPAMRILEILNVIPVYFMNSVLPVLSKNLKENREKAERVVELSMDFLWMASVPIALGLYLLAYPIVFLIAQPEFLSQLDKGIYGSDIALQILAIAMALSFNSSVYNYGLVALGKQSKLLWINGAAAVFNIAINLWAIPLWGFRGAAWVTVATEIFIWIVMGTVARRELRFKVDWAVFSKVSVAGILMGLTVWALKTPSYYWLHMQNLNVLFLTAVGAIVYVGTLFALKTFPKEVRGGMFKR